MKNIFSITFCFLFLFSCSSKKEKTNTTTLPVPPAEKIKFEKKVVVPNVTCEADPSQSFALYLPSGYSDTLQFPVIIFFDPHGDGSLPIQRYRAFADHFGFVLMGSNNSKNGLSFDQTNRIASGLIQETARFAINPRRIALAGFSGGAKVALVAASMHPELLAIIYCGAAVPMENIQQLPPALGFAGLGDMNFVETGSSSRELYEKKIPHCLIEWKGKHEWPDSLVFKNAFYWCDFQSMRNKIIPADPDLIYWFKEDLKANAMQEKSPIEKSNGYSKAIAFLDGLADVGPYVQKQESLSRTAAFRDEMTRRQNLLQMESNLKSSYAQCFQSKDLSWWDQEIRRMQSIKGEQANMYRRLLGYLSLAGYTYSNKAIQQNDFQSAQQFLGIYKLADPENSEQPFLEACLYAKQGDSNKALTSLARAIQMGLHDRTKIETEESLAPLRSMPEFNRLLNSI
jgi:predicted esterase